MTRTRALAEVVICSSYPTQLLAAVLLAMAGVTGQAADGSLNARFVVLVSMADAALVVGLVTLFTRRNGESMRTVFLGTRPIWRDAATGVMLVPAVLLGVSLVVVAVRALVPSLHNVPTNPMGALMADPMMAVVFGVVVVLAGGVREEMQRAFQLHRLTGYVCGPALALALTSVAFGLGHTVQGYDVAIATGVLGLFWGVLYLQRRSVVTAAVSHGLFNLGQVAIGWAAARGGP